LYWPYASFHIYFLQWSIPTLDGSAAPLKGHATSQSTSWCQWDLEACGSAFADVVQARWDFRRDLSIGILSSGFGVDSDDQWVLLWMNPISLIMEFDGLSVDFSSRKFWADFGAGIQYQKCDFQWELCRKEKKRARYTHWYQDRVDSTVRSVPKNRSIHYLIAIIQNRYCKTISIH
jgi:hypothetical protein